MTKLDYLNIASDLRRIASWMTRGEKEKLFLINRLWKDIKAKKESSTIIKHFVGDLEPGNVINDKRKRLFFTEQVLLSSLRLQSLSNIK